MPPRETVAIVVFALVYVVLRFGALPPLRVDRAGATLVLSNVVSNVPAVLLLKGWPALAADAERAWLVLAMTSTLAGNLTLVGSVANLIVVEQSRGRARIGFWSYARVGAPVTLVTLAIGLGWLLLTRR